MTRDVGGDRGSRLTDRMADDDDDGVVAVEDRLFRNARCPCTDPRAIKIAVIVAEPNKTPFVTAFLAGARQSVFAFAFAMGQRC